jgi:hypothetical protein
VTAAGAEKLTQALASNGGNKRSLPSLIKKVSLVRLFVCLFGCLFLFLVRCDSPESDTAWGQVTLPLITTRPQYQR